MGTYLKGFLLAVLSMAGAISTPALAQEDTNAVDRMPLLTNLWFQVGEELIYRVYWGKIPVGTANIKTEWAEEEGRKLLAIRYHAFSNKILSKVYPVDSRFESLIDPVTFKTVRFTRDQKEGRRKHYVVTTFDYTNLTAIIDNKLKNKTKTVALEPETRDLVTFLYALRAWPFGVGENRKYRVMTDDDIYDVWVKVKAREKVALPTYGKVDCVRIEPEAAFDGIFVRKGKVTVWVSDDERRITTRVVGSVPVASINVLLVEVKGPGNDAWIRPAKDVEKDVEEADESRSSAASDTAIPAMLTPVIH